MSKVIITEQYLIDIADAIREKLGVNETYKPSEMGLAIQNIDYKTLLIDNPEYFISETIDTAKKINALRNEHTFITYFITDTHAHTSSNNMQYVDAQLASMHAIAKVIKPDLVIHGGDLVNGSEPKDTTVNEIKHIIKQMRDIGGNDTHILMGNHDGNTYAGSTQEEIELNRITENEMLTLSRAWDDGFTYAGDEYQGGNFYGYRDYSTLNLRIIRLHSYRENINNADYNGGKGQNWGYYEDEQTWFKNVALNTNNDILIFCHQSLAPVLQGFSDAQDIPHGGTIMQQALDTWLEADSNHRCIGVVHGHVHWDYSAKGKGTFNVIDHESKETITRIGNHGNFYEHGLCLANYLPSYSTTDITPVSGYRDVPIGAIQRGRAVETKTQGLWTAIIVDTNAETINFVRFGAGIDQAYSYSAPKINQLPLATDTDNTIYNNIGYKENTRLNSSGNAVAATGYYTTGFIPITSGKLVTFENIQLDADNSISGYNMQYISFYDSNKTLLANCSMYARNWIVDRPALVQPYTLDGTNLISITPHGTQGTCDLTNIAYMRISAKLIDSTSAIYIGSYNESIKPSNNEDIDDIIPQVDIPTYIKNAALEIAHKVSAVQNDSTITFISMSDAHNLLSNNDIRTGIKHAGMAAKAISYMVPLDFFFHGGDATMGSSTTTIADGKAELAEVNYWIDEAAEGVPNFRTPGNHDALRHNTNVTPLTDAELYEFFGKYNDDGITVMGSATAGYCYRDFVEKKVRIICLNTAESAKENVSTMQQLWFCRTLASVPNDYGVIILSHHPLDWGNINPCANILYQFYEKGSYTVDGTTVSFESVNPAYTVCFHGHIHNFLADHMNRVVNSEGIPFNVQRIAVPNICFNRNNEYWQNGAPEYYGIEYGQSTTYNKTADTANDTAFTVNVIDPLNEIVYSYCYGAGIDRVVSIGATVYHMVNTNLTHITNSNTNSIIENNTAYVTTLTADSGYDIQSVTVTMGNTDITSTVYDSSTGIINIASVTDTITITAIAIIHTDYTNLVPTAVDSSGNVVGYKDGYYVSGSGKVGDFSANASFVATGAMALPSGWQYIYVKGVPMLSGDSHERYYFGDANKAVYSSGGYLNATNYSSQYMTIETLGTDYYRISSTHANTKAASFVAMSFKTTTGADLIITVDEPIEQKEIIPDNDNQGEEVIFDDRNQYVIDFLSASSNYTQNNRSNITVIDNYADKNINDQDAPRSFLGKYNLTPDVKNTINGWTVTRLPEPPRMLKLENVWNVRDIGGWPCDGGTVKFNKIFRGARLNNVSASSADATTFAKFGIKLDLDIRDSGNATGNTPIPNCTYRSVPIINAYAQMLSNEPAAAAEACQAAMQSVVDGNPVYIHCASGSDRTGCICAMLEALLGVSDRDIDRDYELTNFSDYEDLTGRKRNGGSWTGFMNAIAAYGAANVKMNVVAFLRSQGVTTALMNAFRVAAIDGTPSDITVTTYTVTNNLTHCTTSNNATSVDDGTSYSATIAAESGYTLDTVTVTMGGTDITATAYSGGVVSIASVTGNITITAMTTSQASYTNLVDTYGYTDGKYISSGNLSTNAADTTIGKIPLTALPSGSALYIKGYTGAASASHTRINISSSASYGSGHISEKNGWLASPLNPLTVETLGTGYYKVTVGGNWSGYYANATHLGLCFAGTKGADLIITINEPIDENIVESVNQLPLATDTDGTVYNGIGYKENTRLNSSGNITTTNGIYATGFIPVTAGQTVTFKNIQLDADNSISGYNMQYITFYDSNKTLLANCSMYARNWIVDQPALVQPYTLDGTNLISITPHGTQGTRDLTNVAFMRISAKLINGTSAIYVE